MKVLNGKGVKSIFIAVLALIFAIVLELSFFVFDTEYEFSGNSVSVYGTEACEMGVSGYEISADSTFTPVSPDPQIIFMNINTDVNSMLITFNDKIFASVDYQVFYSNDGDFNEKNSFSKKITLGSDSLVLSLPEGNYDDIRLDIDGVFTLKSVIATDGNVTAKNVAVQSFSILRTLTVFIIVALSVLLLMRWILSKNPRKLTVIEFLFVGFVFCFYFIWAIAKQYNYAPDEAMRQDVTQFLFEHNRLPVGDELLSEWGFSYAHLPAVLCSQLGYVLMKLVSVFTLNPRHLLLAARMVSALSCTGAVYFMIKLSKLIMARPARWIMIVTVAFMPQFAFLGSYVNNDSVAFLGITMIAYAWALGITDNWNIKNCILLSLGLSTCILSYYNSYAWVLLSVPFFMISYLHKNKKDYKGLFKYVGIVAGLTFLLAGHSFIRHLILYNDLLGFKTSHYYGELYSTPALHPDNRPSIAEQGISLSDMLFDMNWLKTSFMSFIGVFGYMQYTCPDIIYELAENFIIIAIIGCFIGLFIRMFIKQKPDTLKVYFYVACIICAIISVCLSIYNSYNTDFQPQGRYCYPAFLTIAMFIALGYDSIFRLFKNEKHRYALTAILCTAFIGISLYVFYSVYLPS